MTLKIKQMLAIPRTGVNCFGGGNPRKYITIHQTGNTARGADAYMHAKLQQNGWGASWHYSVDDHEAIQSFKHDIKCWHSSDGTGPGNTQSIAIEICINADGNYVQAVKNGAELTAYLMKKENIPLKNIRQHHDWDIVHRKNCPAQIRAGKDGINWNKFLQMVETELSKLKGTKPSKPLKASSSGTSTGNTLYLPKEADTWRIYRVGGPYTKGNEIGLLKPAKFGGLTYSILGNPVTNVYIIQTQDYGKVAIYAGADTGARISTRKAVSHKKEKQLILPASTPSWRVYKVGGSYTKGHEVGFLRPSKFGGLKYSILGNPTTDVYIIQTQDFGKVAIYAGKGTGATIK